MICRERHMICYDDMTQCMDNSRRTIRYEVVLAKVLIIYHGISYINGCYESYQISYNGSTHFKRIMIQMILWLFCARISVFELLHERNGISHERYTYSSIFMGDILYFAHSRSGSREGEYILSTTVGRRHLLICQIMNECKWITG